MSPLHVAVLQDSLEIVSLLLLHAAQVDCADKKGLMLSHCHAPDDAFCNITTLLNVL